MKTKGEGAGADFKLSKTQLKIMTRMDGTRDPWWVSSHVEWERVICQKTKLVSNFEIENAAVVIPNFRGVFMRDCLTIFNRMVLLFLIGWSYYLGYAKQSVAW